MFKVLNVLVSELPQWPYFPQHRAQFKVRMQFGFPLDSYLPKLACFLICPGENVLVTLIGQGHVCHVKCLRGCREVCKP